MLVFCTASLASYCAETLLTKCVALNVLSCSPAPQDMLVMNDIFTATVVNRHNVVFKCSWCKSLLQETSQVQVVNSVNLMFLPERTRLYYKERATKLHYDWSFLPLRNPIGYTVKVKGQTWWVWSKGQPTIKFCWWTWNYWKNRTSSLIRKSSRGGL